MSCECLHQGSPPSLSLSLSLCQLEIRRVVGHAISLSEL